MIILYIEMEILQMILTTSIQDTKIGISYVHPLDGEAGAHPPFWKKNQVLLLSQSLSLIFNGELFFNK
jgi:hypothetical protein